MSALNQYLWISFTVKLLRVPGKIIKKITCLKEHVSKIQPSMGSGWLDGTRKPNASFFKILPKQKKTYWLFEHKKPWVPV